MMSASVSLAAARKRHVVVMNVRKNLVKSERLPLMGNFCAPWFTRKAVVAVGPPPAAFSGKVRDAIQAALEEEQKKKVLAEKERWMREKDMKTKKAEGAQRIAKVKADGEYKRAHGLWERQKAAAEEKGEEFTTEEPTEPEEPKLELEVEEEPNWDEKMKVDEEKVKDLKDLKFRPRCTVGQMPDVKNAMPDMQA